MNSSQQTNPITTEISAEESLGFLSAFLAFHRNPKTDRGVTDAASVRSSNAFLAIFELGLFDTLNFLYNEYTDLESFRQWIIGKKGLDRYKNSVQKLREWEMLRDQKVENYEYKLLTEEQLKYWEEEGYIKISGLVEDEDCDAVVHHICSVLSVDLENSKTWYSAQSDLQGIMLPDAVGDAVEKIRNNTAVRAVFADLYKSDAIFPNILPLGYNPPESMGYAFRGSRIHWDIDFSIGPRFHIQGLLYLHDVPENGGAFSLIPGYHKQIDRLLKEFGTPEAAMQYLVAANLEKHISGKKGDLILWIESLPHAATANKSNNPRFVQYINFGR
ncbi:Phytanoyl-CoA dioxygenase (PhyH) [Sphingobacterium spiritivorum]|uniref:Phytanoyl-CoA dioxygenase (PhyH) n=1 Tax=Sphingobacterium spiritivorum TaxID=258 RepID=A0A380BIV6_SPHSI|nr:phytanoyl-CoA dioxygenase family protein [Sphingobacterium spiritivorum]SUJ01367.1 Phytanoyl-CoA dioxygenase (PhyH) [Sphingobacterium spiritivorum]